MRNFTFVLGFFILMISSCNSSNDKIASTEIDSKKIIAVIKDPKSVSLEKIANLVGKESSEIKIYKDDLSSDISKRAVLFSWQNGEKKSVKTLEGKDLSIIGYHSIGMGFLQKISKKDFQNKFQSKTAIQEEINRITKDESIDADLAIAESKYLAQNSKLQQFEKVENVGELAYWETPVNALHIYNKGISFTITTNLGNEKNSREIALKLTNILLNNLEN